MTRISQPNVKSASALVLVALAMLFLQPKPGLWNAARWIVFFWTLGLGVLRFWQARKPI